MATIKNLSIGEVIPQPDLSFNQDQNGGWSASRSYYMLRETWDSLSIKNRFGRGVAVTTADSTIDSYYDFLTVESRTAANEEGGLLLLTVNYTGHKSLQYGGEGGSGVTLDALPIYRLQSRLRELPLNEHPAFGSLSADEQFALGFALNGDGFVNSDYTQVGTWLEGLNKRIFSPLEDINGVAITLTSATALNFANLIRKGTKSYLSPTYTWTEVTRGSAGLIDGQLTKLGKVDTPRGNPPVAGGTRTWMLTDASQEQQGDLYNTTLEWTLSEQEGWDTFLYT